MLAARILENEEAEKELKDVDDAQTKKKSSKKNKGLTSEILKDNRFKAMFENQVQYYFYFPTIAKSAICLVNHLLLFNIVNTVNK